jgi:AcrR family transcriptional regulator
MTVYHQFGSKTGLLEALCDSLAANAGMQEVAAVFCQEQASEALQQYLHIFGRFWSIPRVAQ